MALEFNNTNATLNNMFAVFEEIANNHAQINHFGFGEQYEIEANTVENYPFLWVYTLPATLNEAFITYNFRVIIMDLVEADISNQTEVQSDSILILYDILFLLRDTYGFDIPFGYQVTPFSEKYNDRVSGWYIDTKIAVPQSFGNCDVPTKSLTSNITFLIDSDATRLTDELNEELTTV